MLDALTGIPGRRELGFRAEEAIDEVHNSGEPLCVLLLDVDGLAHYNDTYGTNAGDVALRTLARLLDDFVRPAHIVARCGNDSDEFAVLAKVDLSDALVLAETIRVRAEIDIKPLTVSIVVTARPGQPGYGEREMLEVCAVRMQSARLNGARNLVAARPVATYLLSKEASAAGPWPALS